ncbi:MAG TPA: HetP family heterocyst commitment protein [Candidatus Caenarcaniphilales bacterium]
MYQQNSTYKTVRDKPVNKVITTEQFNQIVDAILDGKYSWACVLLLRFSGHNPLHYIPYRTYNRLAKENCQIGRLSRHKTDSLRVSNEKPEYLDTAAHKHVEKISDLAHLEIVEEQHTQIYGRGNNQDYWLSKQSQPVSLIKGKLLQFKKQVSSFF